MDPLTLAIPEQIESSRLVLRAPRSADATQVNAAVCESFAELKKWMPWAQTLPSLEVSQAVCQDAIKSFQERTELRWHIFSKDSSELVGIAGLHCRDWSVPRFEIGYWVRTSHAGKGYITEAVIALTQFAFSEIGANRIEIIADKLNTRSCKIAEKLGFTLEGTLRNHKREIDSQLRDSQIYAMVALQELRGGNS